VATERWRDVWSDAEESISILIALPRPCADKYWHQRLLWFVNWVREEPLEVSHGARLLPRLFRQIGQEGVATVPRTVPLLAEPSVSMGNEPNATIAICIGAFHDTFLPQSMKRDFVMCDPPAKH
jgi:hypothetical protein